MKLMMLWTWKEYLARLISISLFASTLYQMLLSLNAIFFIYPLIESGEQNSQLIQEGLVEKAFVLYLTMIMGGFWSVTLLFTSGEKLKIFHILAGIAIFAFSVYYMIETPFTTDPVQDMIKDFIFNQS